MNHIRTKKTGNRINAGKNSFPQRGFRQRNNKTKMSSIKDPNVLIKKAILKEEVVYTPSRSFNQMPVNSKIKVNLAKKGFTEPTQIQEETLEYLISGRNLIGVANTGTGKTSAFLVPIIHRLLRDSKPFTSLVVVPTRELALQIKEEFRSLSKGMGLYAACLIGGTNVGRDIAQLKMRNHIIIGTPGRLLDLSQRGALRLQTISVLVLDEFDRMLDMGFINDIQKIVKSMHNRKQTMLFSATIDKMQGSLINQMVHNPVEVKVSSGNTTSDQVDQDIIKVPRGRDKFEMLRNLMDDEQFQKVLIFAETKRMVDRVSRRLNQSGIRSDRIHGDKTQNYRNKALDNFKRGNVQVLVATDVAARGIDISNITHVINYQLPMSFNSYLHRIGRTGRAGDTGKALTFVDETIQL
jgi:ATP-dependent RNA helicase RhlE